MVDLANQSPAQLLSREMGLTEQAAERRRRIVGIDAQDLERIASIKALVSSSAAEHAAVFFDYLSALEEGRALLANRSVAERARQLKREHLTAMVQGDYGMNYVIQRLELAILYSKAGLDLRVFLAAFHHPVSYTHLTLPTKRIV